MTGDDTIGNTGSWSRIDTNFDPDEETANFGTRHAIENGKLFDVFTHATVSPDGFVVKDPWLLSRSRKNPDKLALVVDKNLHVFTHDLQDVFSIAFSHIVDVLEWTPNENFLICALRSGQIQFVHLPSKRPLPAMQTSFEAKFGRTFVGIASHQKSSEVAFSLFTTAGKMLRVTSKGGVPLDKIHEAISNQDFSALKELQTKILVRDVDDSKIGKFTGTVPALNGSKSVISMGNTLGLYDPISLVSDISPLWNKDEEIAQILVPQKNDHQIIFVLSNSGVVNVVCALTMMNLYEFEMDKVKGLALIEDENDPVLKLFLTVERCSTKLDDNVETFLQIVEYPSFEILYELKVAPYCKLLDVSIDQENPLFIEGSYGSMENDENTDMNVVIQASPDCVRMLRIRGICEGNAESRLMRLLAKKKFEEAEKFATANGINLEEVRQAKAKWIMSQLSSSMKNEMSDEKHKSALELEFEAILHELTDLEFMVLCSLNVTHSNLKMTRDLLIKARLIIQNNLDQDLDESLMFRVNQALYRLDTFIFLHKDMMNKNNQVQLWHEFSRADMLEECKKRLEIQDFKSALIIWNRHQSDFDIHASQILELLRCLPSSSSENVGFFTQFMIQFLPDCLHLVQDKSHASQILEILAKWIIYTTKSLEAEKNSNWPESGIRHAQTMLDALHVKDVKDEAHNGLINDRIPLLLQQHSNTRKFAFFKLATLIETLKDLKLLHEKYRLKVKLNDFDVEDKTFVINMLLDWCSSPQEVQSLIEGFLKGFLKRFGYDLNKVLAEYLVGLVQETEFCWYTNDSAPWEKTAVVIIEAIDCNTTKFEMILESLRQAPAPWSEDIQQLVSLGLSLNHPGTSLITEQEKLVIVKQMVVKYKLGKSYNRQGSEAEKLLRGIFKNKQDLVALQDAVKVAEVLCGVEKKDAIRLYIEKLIEIDQHREALKHVENLDQDKRVEIIEMILIKAELTFEIKESMMLFLSVAILTLRNSASKFDDLDERITLVKKNYWLRSSYGIRNCSDIKDFIKKSVDDNNPNVEKLYVSLQKIADLSNQSLQYLVQELLSELFGKPDKLDDILKVLSLFNSDHHAFGGEFIQNIVVQMKHTQLIPPLRKLISINTTLCHDQDLTDAIDISSWSQLLEDLQDESSMFENTELDLVKYKMTSNYFKDKGLPMDDDLKLVQPVQLIQMHQNIAKEMTNLRTMQRDLCSVSAASIDSLDPQEDDKVEKKNREIDNYLAKLDTYCSGLQSRNQSYLVFKVLKHIEWKTVLLYSSELSEKILDLQQEITPKILAKMLTEKKPDLTLALSYLSGQLKTKSALKALAQLNSRLGNDNLRLTNLSRLGARYCSRIGLYSEKDQFFNLFTKATWARKLGLNGLDLAGIPDGSEDHLNCLSDFIGRLDLPPPKFVIKDLKQYAKAFSLMSISAVMKVFIKKILISNSLSPESIVEDGNSSGTTRFNQKLFDSTLDFLDEALKFLDDKADIFLGNVLKNDVSPYNYEVIGCILKRFEERDSKLEQFLEFLMNYSRSCPPSEEEIDNWLNSKSSPFPMFLAKKRLPFHPMIKAKNDSRAMFKILENEFVIETYQQWLDASTTFKLKHDTVRFYASKNTVSQVLSQQKIDPNDQSWHTDPIFSMDALKQVFECLEGIIDLYKSTAGAQWISNRLPRGNEKLLVARICLQFASKLNEELGDEDAIKVLLFAKQTAIKLEVEQILQKHGLNYQGSRYFELVHQDKFSDLVMALYEDESIVKRCTFKESGDASRWPNINKACTEIAKVVNEVLSNSPAPVNLILIKYKLLDMWLPEKIQEGGGGSLDETVTNFNLLKSLQQNSNGPDQVKEGTDIENENNYWRSVYILQGFTEAQENEGIEYLYQVIFSHDHGKWPINHQLRALKCLLSVIGTQNLGEILEKSTEDLEARFQNLCLVSKLESLNLPYHSVEALQACDKSSLIESVLRSCGHLPEGIALVVDLCVNYKIFKPTLWAKLISKLLILGQGPKIIKRTLLAMNRIPALWHLSEFNQAWKMIIFEPFRRLTGDTPSQALINECKISLELLQRCPIASEIGVSELYEDCLKIGEQTLLDLISPLTAIL